MQISRQNIAPWSDIYSIHEKRVQADKTIWHKWTIHTSSYSSQLASSEKVGSTSTSVISQLCYSCTYKHCLTWSETLMCKQIANNISSFDYQTPSRALLPYIISCFIHSLSVGCLNRPEPSQCSDWGCCSENSVNHSHHGSSTSLTSPINLAMVLKSN